MKYDGVSPDELGARLQARGFLCLPTVSSTLDVVHELAAEGAPAGTVVLADEQVRGRGRHGRPWHSPPGVGIWLGCLARPRGRASPGVLSVRVGLMIAEELGRLDVDVKLKWPNDVMVDGRKLAGVLCEARWREERVLWVAVGVGLNVRGPLPRDIAASACSLDEFVPGATRIDVLERLVPRLCRLPDTDTLSPREREAYAARDLLAGRDLASPVAGRACGVGADGALLVKTLRGVEPVTSGSVTLPAA